MSIIAGGRSRITLLCCLVALLACTLAPSAQVAARGAPHVRVLMHSSSGTRRIRMWATVYTEPETRCWGTLRQAKVPRLTGVLPRLTTVSTGDAEWRWRIADGVPSGQWRITVRCWLHGGIQTAHGGVAATGPARGSAPTRLIAPGSLKISGDTTGTGGGGANLYPQGECTWWVKRKRPDLPWFPDRSGEARNWARSAAKAGFVVDDTPEVGAVAVFQPGQYDAGRSGHVAYVVAVEGDHIVISEAGFGRLGPNPNRRISWRGLQFIHNKRSSSRRTGETTPTTPPPPEYHVYHTCANNHCGVPQQSGPGYALYQSHGAIPDDTAVDVTCQRKGEPVAGTNGTSSDIWDLLTTGFYVADYFVDTPGKLGAFTASIPACGGDAPPSDTTRRTFTYHVGGTCLDGQCGLRERSGPGYRAYPVTAVFNDGWTVYVVCQVTGEDSVSGTTVWDKLADDFYVSDYYVDTPGGATKLDFTDSIPRC